MKVSAPVTPVAPRLKSARPSRCASSVWKLAPAIPALRSAAFSPSAFQPVCRPAARRRSGGAPPGAVLSPHGRSPSRTQIVSGIYDLEDHSFRWMSRLATVALKSPAAAAALTLSFRIPAQSPARRVTLRIDGKEVASQTYVAAGDYTLESPPVLPATPEVLVEIEVDRTFNGAPGRPGVGDRPERYRFPPLMGLRPAKFHGKVCRASLFVEWASGPQRRLSSRRPASSILLTRRLQRFFHRPARSRYLSR